MAFESALRGIREAGASAIAVVSRDGSVLSADLPAGVSRETFSIMCATIHGAGMTVSNELKRPNPRLITLDSADGPIVIAEAGRRALIVYVLGKDIAWADVSPRMAPFVEQVARETG